MQPLTSDPASGSSDTGNPELSSPQQKKTESSRKSTDTGSGEDVPAIRGRIEALLTRYPDLSKAEADELVALYQAALPVERALLQSDHKLAGLLDRFRREHHRSLRTPFRQYASLVAIAVLGVATAAYAIVVGG